MVDGYVRLRIKKRKSRYRGCGKERIREIAIRKLIVWNRTVTLTEWRRT